VFRNRRFLREPLWLDVFSQRLLVASARSEPQRNDPKSNLAWLGRAGIVDDLESIKVLKELVGEKTRLGRRNLTDDQRAMIAEDVRE
jgi:hypothetical protein